MTREEAIVHGKEQLDVFGGEHAEFIKLAIKALEQEPCDDISKKERWIPCSERLPEENGRYLVTRGLNDCGSLWNRVYIVNYSDLMGLKKEKIWWSGNVGKSDFERHDNVLAWMPLSAPYNAEMKNEKVCNGCYYDDGKVHAECVVCAKAEKMP